MVRTDRRSRGATRLEVLLTLGLLASFAAFVLPRWRGQHESAQLTALECDLEALRTAIARYTADHGGPPGVRNEQVSSEILIEQLCQTTDAQGQVRPRGPFGPYLPAGLPANPINGLHSVWLAEGESIPSPDSRTGWLFHLATGQIRANTSHVPFPDEAPVFEL